MAKMLAMGQANDAVITIRHGMVSARTVTRHSLKLGAHKPNSGMRLTNFANFAQLIPSILVGIARERKTNTSFVLMFSPALCASAAFYIRGRRRCLQMNIHWTISTLYSQPELLQTIPSLPSASYSLEISFRVQRFLSN